MSKYKVRVYEVGALGFFTQADGYMDYNFTSDDSLEQFARRLSREGFAVEDGRKWICPAAIITVEIVG